MVKHINGFGDKKQRKKVKINRGRRLRERKRQDKSKGDLFWAGRKR